MLKKTVLLFIFLLLNTAVFAAPDKTEKVIASQFTLKAGSALSIYEPWVTANLEYMFLFQGWLGLGAEAGIHYGLTFQDIHSTGFLLLRLGWFYLGGGVSYEIKDSMLPPDSKYVTFTPSNAINPAITAGLIVPIFELGPGSLGINASVDWYVTDIPIYPEEYQDEGIAAYIIRVIFSGIAQTVTGVLLSGKPAVELTYTFTL